jgi:hypothetical protein
MKRVRTSADIIAGINKRGWWPSPWAHHPPEIRAALRSQGWRPRVKQCFSNCQRFILGAIGTELEQHLEYREGWATVSIPMEHAWLLYKGEVMDMTLGPNAKVEYGESLACTTAEIIEVILMTQMYGIIKPRELAMIGPFAQLYKDLEKSQKS